MSALGFFGGPTLTFALLPGSPAIGAGTSTGAPATDQRGFTRTGAIDIGAFQTGPLVVNTTFDSNTSGSSSGKLSLREAINLANIRPGADAITFDYTMFGTPQTIALAGTQLALTDTTGETTIAGPTAGVTVSGNNASRVFFVAASASGDITGLTISGGKVTASSEGGGVLNQGTLFLTDCTLSGNTADAGGALSSAAFVSSATVTLTNCTLSGNTAASGVGGAVSNFSGASGVTATITFTNCTLYGNSANDNGGGLSNVAGSGTATATLTNSIVAGNTASKNADISGTVTGSNNLIGTGGSGGLVDGVIGNPVVDRVTSKNKKL